MEDLNSGVIHLNELGHLKVEQGPTCSLKKTVQGGRRPAEARRTEHKSRFPAGVQVRRGATLL